MCSYPKVSIIVPVYNPPEAYLRECVESLVNQTLHEIEIILINNQANEACSFILESYARQDPRIILHRFEENQGYSGACNKGIELSAGKYLQIVDSDDYLDQSACELLYARAEQDDVDMVFLSSEIWDERKHQHFKVPAYEWADLPLEIRDKVFNFEEIAQQVFFAPSQAWNKFYKKLFIVQNHNYFDMLLKRASPDAFFSFNNYLNAQKMCLVEATCYYYRVNVGEGVVSGLAARHCDYFTETIVFFYKVVELMQRKLPRQYHNAIKKVIILAAAHFYGILHKNNKHAYFNLLKKYFNDKEVNVFFRSQPSLSLSDFPEYSFYQRVKSLPYYIFKIRDKIFYKSSDKLKVAGINFYKKKERRDFIMKSYLYFLFTIKQEKGKTTYYIFLFPIMEKRRDG